MKNLLLIIVFTIVSMFSAVSAAELPAAAAEHESMASMYMEAKDFNNALFHYNKELSILRDEFGESDPLCISVMNNISSCYIKTKAFDNAVQNSCQAIEILKRNIGEHTERYIEALRNLKSIYFAQQKYSKAEEMELTISRLENEIHYGYTPALVNFRNAQVCHENNTDAYYCCIYYLNNQFKTKDMKGAARYITNWVAVSEDVKVIVTPELMEIFDNPAFTAYGIAFMAGSAEYALRQNSSEDVKNQYAHAVIRLLNYYKFCKAKIGNCPILDKYIRIYDSNPNKLYQHMSDQFDSNCRNFTLVHMKQFV